MNRVATFCLAMLATGACLAQTAADSLDGKWTANFQAQNGVAREAKVSIKGDAGTWQLMTARLNRENPCAGKEMPLKVTREEDLFKLTMSPSQALAGCGEDFSFRFSRVSDKQLEAKLRDGRVVTLTRD